MSLSQWSSQGSSSPVVKMLMLVTKGSLHVLCHVTDLGHLCSQILMAILLTKESFPWY